MTEQEAEHIRCCGPSDCGRLGDPEYEGGPCLRYCIGSKCMAWREHYKMEIVDRNSNQRRPAVEGEQYNARLERLTAKLDGGYCGLAGKP